MYVTVHTEFSVHMSQRYIPKRIRVKYLCRNDILVGNSSL